MEAPSLVVVGEVAEEEEVRGASEPSAGRSSSSSGVVGAVLDVMEADAAAHVSGGSGEPARRGGAVDARGGRTCTVRGGRCSAVVVVGGG